jgi:hypothetical protein
VNPAVAAYIESRIEALVEQGRLPDAAVDKAAAKGLLRAERVAEVKAKRLHGPPAGSPGQGK